MAESNATDDIRVLVTGFGPFLDITTNPSWEIACNLPSCLTSSNGTNIRLILPDTYMPAAYHKILPQTTGLIEQHDPDLIVHMGLAVDRSYFAVEQSAGKEGYHDIPDVDRKVFTRAENKKVFGKAPSSLTTSFDLETVVSVWRDACSRLSSKGKGKSKGKPKTEGMVHVRLSDDVGTFVCGFVYYISMLEMQRKKGRRDVVFFHVPKLEGEEQVGVGVEVTKELIVALVDGWKSD